jgi:DNA-binding MarR family transcriptional regulator
MTAHSSKLDAERLLQLSDEVGRIAGTLARLSVSSTEPAAEATQPVPDMPLPEVSPDTIHAVIRARRLRERYFEPELFADPGWDVLLDLLLAEILHRRVSVSSACMAAAVPATTALRWLNTLTQKGLIIRRADPHDGRRVFIELTRDGSLAMRRFFAEAGSGVVI